MGREINFRAWLTNDNGESKMLYDYAANSRQNGEIIKPSFHSKSDFYIVKECVLMQFTGLYDKNNNPIYEGDVVEVCHPHKDRKYIGEIVYKDNMFTGKDFYFSHHDVPDNIFESIKYTEVIGNKFEHPELLKK